MHPFVVGLFEQCLDPAIISLQPPDTVEVSEHASNHAGHTGDRLQEDKADHPLRLGQGFDRLDGRGRVLLVDCLVFPHARKEVHAPTTKSHELPGSPIAKRLGISMGRDHVEHLLLSVAMVRPGRQGLTDVLRLLHGEEVSHVGYRRGREVSCGSMLLYRHESGDAEAWTSKSGLASCFEAQSLVLTLVDNIGNDLAQRMVMVRWKYDFQG